MKIDVSSLRKFSASLQALPKAISRRIFGPLRCAVGSWR
jgi:hypothetical protein